MALSDKEKTLISELSKRGHSSREISNALWGTPTRKSTVNNYLARVQEIMESSRVLVYDIETAPAIGYYWRRFKENIGQPQVIQESYMLTWSAKWYGENSMIERKISDYSVDFTRPNDKGLVEELGDLLNQADYVVAHNGDRFDLPTFNARCVVHGIDIPSPMKAIDTLKIAKRHFRFPSNSLKSLAIYLGLDQQKQDVDFSLWRRVMEGDPLAVEAMARYCSQDVLTLEDVYTVLRPYDSRHPNVAIKGELDIPRCIKCGSADVEKTDKTVQTNVSLFEHYKCNCCGANLRGRKNILDKDKRVNILANVT